MIAIMKLTMREILYKRIFHVILILTSIFLITYAIGTYYVDHDLDVSNGMDPLTKPFLSTQLLGMGLYFAAFIVSLLAIFSSVGSISKEIESKQIDPILSRPLSRSSFIWGRFIGMSILLAVYAFFLFLCITMINQWLGGGLKVVVSGMQLLSALALFVFQPILLVAISLALSARFSSLNCGITMVMLYVLGMISGFIEQIGAMAKSTTMINIGIISSLIFPLDSLFRKMTIFLFDSADDPLSFATQGIFGSMSVPSNAMLIYAVIYGLVALAIAMQIFAKRDV
ncbi:ABC-2 family transporter protein [Marininema mesophilum]|uniref:ABC-2 family transporter protein n=1 Tax=Marininema mesophilum TaxID=1048340 RepID=A0A1H3B984_9BACL|nr:ABC transporter permease [Marininema mesophilum]SDX38355.1 ABC-2 family transporter protein [Marininema mesophilum]